MTDLVLKSTAEKMQVFAGLATIFLFVAVLALAGTGRKTPAAPPPESARSARAVGGGRCVGGGLSTFSKAPEYTALRFV